MLSSIFVNILAQSTANYVSFGCNIGSQWKKFQKGQITKKTRETVRKLGLATVCEEVCAFFEVLQLTFFACGSLRVFGLKFYGLNTLNKNFRHNVPI